MFGEVAERSNATDCKSVGLAPSEVRILPSPPAFARCSRVRRSGRRAMASRPCDGGCCVRRVCPPK